jgi:hypothetical protein
MAYLKWSSTPKCHFHLFSGAFKNDDSEVWPHHFITSFSLTHIFDLTAGQFKSVGLGTPYRVFTSEDPEFQCYHAIELLDSSYRELPDPEE